MAHRNKEVELMQCIRQYRSIVHHKYFPMNRPIFDILDDIRIRKIHHYLYTIVIF